MPDRHKVIFIGDINVGKSSINSRLMKREFRNISNPTIGACYNSLKIDDNYAIDFWDTSGEERYNSLLKLYYNKASVVFLVYDLSNYVKTIKKILNIISEIYSGNNENITFIIIGNKLDLVKEEEIFNIKRYVKNAFSDYNIKNYYMVSAKTNDNINDLLEYLIKIVKTKMKEPEIEKVINLSIVDTTISKSWFC